MADKMRILRHTSSTINQHPVRKCSCLCAVLSPLRTQKWDSDGYFRGLADASQGWQRCHGRGWACLSLSVYRCSTLAMWDLMFFLRSRYARRAWVLEERFCRHVIWLNRFHTYLWKTSLPRPLALAFARSKILLSQCWKFRANISQRSHR